MPAHKPVLSGPTKASFHVHIALGSDDVVVTAPSHVSQSLAFVIERTLPVNSGVVDAGIVTINCFVLPKLSCKFKV